MSVQNGDVVIVQIGGVQLGALISNAHNSSSDMLDESNKDLPGIKQFDPGDTGWTFSLESLYDPAASEGVSEALGYLKAGTSLTVLHGVPGSSPDSGTGLIASIDLSGPRNEISSYSLEIQGTGLSTSGYGPELHVAANAASDPNLNEADAITGWTSAIGGGANVFESQGAVKNIGDYALHVDVTDTPSSGAYIRLTLVVEDGESYYITFNWRNTGTGALNGNWGWRVDGDIQAEDVWVDDLTFEAVTKTIVATSAEMILQWNEANSQNDGGIYLDNVSVRKIL